MNVFCSTSFPLTSTRWVRTTIKLCTLHSLSSALSFKSKQHQEIPKKSWECWESNPALLGVKGEHYLCAMPDECYCTSSFSTMFEWLHICSLPLIHVFVQVGMSRIVCLWNEQLRGSWPNLILPILAYSCVRDKLNPSFQCNRSNNGSTSAATKKVETGGQMFCAGYFE